MCFLSKPEISVDNGNHLFYLIIIQNENVLLGNAILVEN